MRQDRTNPAPIAGRPPTPRRLTRAERAAWDAALPRLEAAGVANLAYHGAELEFLVDAWCGLVRARNGWRAAKDGTSRATWKRLAEARRNDARSVAAVLRTDTGEQIEVATAADAAAIDAALSALFGAHQENTQHAEV
jgi:hypothetical protein